MNLRVPYQMRVVESMTHFINGIRFFFSFGCKSNFSLAYVATSHSHHPNISRRVPMSDMSGPVWGGLFPQGIAPQRDPTLYPLARITTLCWLIGPLEGERRRTRYSFISLTSYRKGRNLVKGCHAYVMMYLIERYHL